MYQILLGIQIFCIILIVIEIIFVYFQRISKEKNVFLLALLSLLLYVICYTYEIESRTFEMALLLTKFSYIGKVYMVPFFMIFTLYYCRVKVSKWLEIILLTIPIFILSLVFTAEKHTLYYATIEFVEEGYFPHLEVRIGIMYYAYIFYLLIYLIAMVVILVRRYKSVKDTEDKKVIFYFGIAMNMPFLGLLIYFSGIIEGYDTTALSYVISCGIILMLISKYDLFGTVTIAKEAVIDNINAGTVLLKDNEVIYANQYFENLMELINRREETFIHEWASNNKIVVYNERAYELELDTFDEYNIQNIQGLTIHDITDRYFYEKNLEQAVYDKTKEIQYIEKEFIISLANIIEERANFSGYHVKQTNRIVKYILEELKDMGKFEESLTDQYCLDLINSALLYDIGKITVTDIILNKPDKLTEDEFEIIKTHTVEGAKIIENILSKLDGNNYLEIAKDVTLYHHEKWNGKGYPHGLIGEEIPLAARIISIADVYDALISKKAYKEAYSLDEAIYIIKMERGKSFDPIIVEAFLRAHDKMNDQI
ncbi:MAG: histidine kinase N-terminal 7TM domain-containing protein [Lachnospiraceae bacterium]